MEVRFTQKVVRRVSTYSCGISVSSGKIEQRHQPHTIKTHATTLRFPAVENNAMSDEHDGRYSKASIQGSSIRAESRVAESRIESDNGAGYR